MNRFGTPYYDLCAFQRMFLNRSQRSIRRSAHLGAFALKMSVSDMEHVVSGLTRPLFDERMRSDMVSGAWLDVYKPTHKGVRLYVKVQIIEDRAVLVSFKKDTDEPAPKMRKV